jgi:carbonic anhydrase
MDAPTLQQLLEALIALILLIYAAWQNRKATAATTEKKEVVAYFTPGEDSVTVAPETLPGRSYKMSDQTKRWLTFDHPVEEQEQLLRQVAEAESEKLATYTITVPSAWYDIEYGLIKGSGKQGDI